MEMSKLTWDHRTFLADAHIIAIRKLCLPVISHYLFAPPGPPLPSAHPSPSLLAKLFTHVSTLYSSATALLHAYSGGGRTVSRADNKDKDKEEVDGDLVPELSRYLRKEHLIAAAQSLKWHGVDAGENGKGQKVGEALAWVKEARSRLEELEDGKLREKMKGLSFGKGREKKKEERKARQGRVEREGEDLDAWIRAYQRMNDTVSGPKTPCT